jgi:hypothetical protein
VAAVPFAASAPATLECCPIIEGEPPAGPSLLFWFEELLFAAPVFADELPNWF